MQLNKVFKGLMLALPLVAVAACSSNKNDDQADTNNVPVVEQGPTAEELARQQLEQLKQQNIVYFGFDKYDISSDYANLLDAHAAF
ncbi:peptidoglycan-associated outer membrane lipoprotein, partial [Escherichia coli]|nr:peptidoglycan-associated outer membrane lipoprotein [Escherichia coli]